MTLKKSRLKAMGPVLASLLAVGLGFVMYGIHATKRRLENIVDSSVLRKKKNTEYIYVPKSLVRNTTGDWDENGPSPDTPLAWVSWWERRKKRLLWRLVEMANSAAWERTRAVESLAAYTDLQDYEYYELALACSPRTLVALARTKNADRRFFQMPRPPGKKKSQQELIDSLHELLINFCKTSRHPCLHYFLKKVFPKEPKCKAWSYLSDLDVYGFVCVPPTTVSQETVLPLCIDALVHHCSVNEDSKGIVESGALQLLYDCKNKLNSDRDTCYRISAIIATVSTHAEFIQDLYQTGWITIMADWIQGSDNKLSTVAATMLANLDRDTERCATYKKEVVLLHPAFRGREQVTVDVVLIHGLLGGVHYTWRQRGLRKQPISILGMATGEEPLMECAKTASVVIDEAPHEIQTDCYQADSMALPGAGYVFVMTDIPETESFCSNTSCCFEGDCLSLMESMQKAEFTMCWPKDWLPKDCKNLRVLGINYDTRLTDWTNWCPLRDRKSNRLLAERCKKLLTHLLECGLGERPVVWITHSMGGIVMKHLLTQAWSSSDPSLRKLCQNTKGAVFLSTPHIGSPWATLHEAWRFFFWPSTEVDELRYQSPALQKLHEDFLKFVEEYPIEIISFVETKSMTISEFDWEIHCVPPNIGDTGAGIIYGIPLGHLDICKPDGQFSFIYQRILSLVRSIVEKSGESSSGKNTSYAEESLAQSL